MNVYNVFNLAESVCFSDDVYLDKNFLLLIRGHTLSNDLKKMLREWEFSKIYSEGDCLEASANSVQSPPKEMKEEAFAPKAVPIPSSSAVAKVYSQFAAFAKQVYDGYMHTKTLQPIIIIAKVKELTQFVKKNKQSILVLQNIIAYDTANIIATHVLRSTIFAIIIGMQIKMGDKALADLAVSCFLHKIGLAHIPLEVYTADTKLSEEQKRYLHAHPVIASKILKKLQFTLPICLGVLDHHEFENGTGYPQRLTSDKISKFGKIIAIACAYEESISPGKNKEICDPAEGLLNLFMYKRSLYDGNMVRALVCALSLFPIGSFVVLSTGNIGQVIDANPKDPRMPVVRIFGKSSDPSIPEIIQTSINGIGIKRAATQDEWKSFFNEK